MKRAPTPFTRIDNRHTSVLSLSAVIILSIVIGSWMTRSYDLPSVAIAHIHREAPQATTVDERGICDLDVVDCPNEHGLSVEVRIRSLAEQQGFRWPDYLVRLAYYESRFNPNATHTNSNGSVDRGVFQWNNKAHPEVSDACAFSVDCATQVAMRSINEGHQTWWMTDKLARNQ